MRTNTWTHPTTGEQRRYLDGAEIADMWIDVQGKVSNADIARIECAKFWLDANGTLVIEHLSERGRIDAAAIRAMVEAAIAADKAAQDAVAAAESAGDVARIVAAQTEGVDVTSVGPIRTILTDTRDGRTLVVVDEGDSEWRYYGWTADDGEVPGRHHVGRVNANVAAVVRDWIAAN